MEKVKILDKEILTDKEIYFCVDVDSMKNIVNVLNDNVLNNNMFTLTYNVTEEAIQSKYKCIVTTSLAHLSFDLLEDGYAIYLCYKDKKVKIEPHMDLSGIGEPCKDLRFGHNIFKLFRAGIFNNLLGI